VGTRILGSIAARIPKRGCECEVVAYDVCPNLSVEAMGIPSLPLEKIWATFDRLPCTRPCSLPRTTC